jgi:hypothetical protein
MALYWSLNDHAPVRDWLQDNQMFDSQISQAAFAYRAKRSNESDGQCNFQANSDGSEELPMAKSIGMT